MIAALTLSIVLPAMAQNAVYLTLDPVSNMPTVVAETNTNNPIRFNSINYLVEEDPVPFFLQFGPEFNGMFIPGGVATDAVITAFGVIFASELKTSPGCVRQGGPNVICQQVTINLRPESVDIDHPDDGYKYSVVMGTKVLDPRIVPN